MYWKIAELNYHLLLTKLSVCLLKYLKYRKIYFAITINVVDLITKQIVDSIMENEATIKATEAELEILNILWATGPATVREVHDKLALKKDAGYTTTLKQMQVMHEKQLVSREPLGKAHLYAAIPNQQQTQGQIVQRMIDSVFNGSAMQLVMQALGNHKASKAELDTIREYLDKKEKK